MQILFCQPKMLNVCSSDTTNAKITYSNYKPDLEEIDVDEMDTHNIKCLARAMIERSILDCKLKHESIKKKSGWLTKLVNDPEYWVFHDTSEDFPSFLACCELLGFHPNVLRKFTRGYIEGTIHKTQPFCRNYVSRPMT